MTLRYLYGQDELVADFVARMIPHVRARGFGKCRAIGIVDNDNELIAGWVYHNMSPEAGRIEISVASLPGKRWCTRETLRLIYQTCFTQYGCQMVVSTLLASDERNQGPLAALGYTFLPFPRLFGRERDGIICCLTYEDWMANKLCQKYKHHVVVTTGNRKAA